ncbi:MAG: glutamate--tRNA ligase [Deltaproteobacteria bacterium]|nr:MAG: glutamate--tRNA ligase [Deltaproteobacteria bacterium]
MVESRKKVRVRIAPSPTGDPHVGTAYVGLINYVFARQRGGKFVLRIEDTDQLRSRPEYEEAILKSLRWLGLNWDEGPDVGGPYKPYRQSERKEIYQKYAGALLKDDRAYSCFCTPERLNQMRSEQISRKETPGYDGLCRGIGQKEAEKRISSGEPAVVRLRIPRPGETVLSDRIRDEIRFDHSNIDDQVLLKSDGMPTYHLANVVDDHLMEITHVIRAEEWINSTPKHLILYRALGWEPPEFIHLPLLRNRDGSKISKRKNPVSLDYYREMGFLPEAMLNFLGMLGWAMPDEREVFSLEDMIAHFSFERISPAGPVFDLEKLKWLNGNYIRELSDQELLRRIREQVFPEERMNSVVPLVRERLEMLSQYLDVADFFFLGDIRPDLQDLIPKKKDAREAADILGQCQETLESLVSWKTDKIEETLRKLCEEKGYKTRDLFMTLRVAVTGKRATPPLCESMEVVGKAITMARIGRAIAALESAPK